MAHLSLAGTSDDGRLLLLVDDEGAEHTLGVDARLRSALRAQAPRPGQLETQMDSALRPRDIQARIRAGETPEAVAAAAQTTVEKIMAFAGPVIAERQHVVQRALASTVRRRSGDAGGARTLGDVVAGHLRRQGVAPESVEWDAWRREDGRWALTAEFASSRREGTAAFVFDAPGAYVLLDGDDARWLVGEEPAEPAPVDRGGSDDLSAVRARRLTSVGDDLPLGDDAIEMVSGPEVEVEVEVDVEQVDVEPVVEHEPRTRPPEPDLPESDLHESDLHDDPAAEPVPQTTAEQPAAEDPDQPQLPGTDVEADDGPPRRPVQKKRGRASVPTWDEIMFGGRDQ